jgi:hypothetical protein
LSSFYKRGRFYCRVRAGVGAWLILEDDNNVLYALATSGNIGQFNWDVALGDAPTPAGGWRAVNPAASGIVGGMGGAANTTVNGSTVTVTGDVTIRNGVVTVPTGVTLAVADGVNLMVAAGSTLSVPTGATVNAGANAAIEVSGAYNLGDGVTGENNGTVTVKSGGTIRNGTSHLNNDDEDVGTGISITGDGTNIVESGGTVYFGGRTTPFIGGPATTANFQVQPNAKFSYKDGSMS